MVVGGLEGLESARRVAMALASSSSGDLVLEGRSAVTKW